MTNNQSPTNKLVLEPFVDLVIGAYLVFGYW